MKIQFDTKGWTQDQINLIHASLRQIVDGLGYQKVTIVCVGDTCSIDGVPDDFAITEKDILDQWAIDDSLRKEAEALESI